MQQRIKQFKIFLADDWMRLAIILAFVIFMPFASPYFFSMKNFMNILQNISLQGITAIGMTIVIITGGIDISVGGVMAFSVWVAASLMKSGTPWPLACCVALAIAAVCGSVNAFSIGVMRIPPMIATLAMMNMTRGLQTVISRGTTLTRLPEGFQFIGQGSLFGIIPLPAILILAFYIFAAWFMQKTITGRSIYAVGGNPEAARVAGIKNNRIIFFAYIACSVLATIAGLIFISRTNSAPATVGINLEMKAIMAAVIGGTSVTFGGKGKIIGTLLGVVIVGFITNALDLLGVSAYYQQFIQGVLVLAVVFLEAVRSTRAARRH
ncbi:MAG: ABC transporter permease [Planctomycetes bacterium]|nr:ABC transporter permease [Planctomycetota bacterium]